MKARVIILFWESVNRLRMLKFGGLIGSWLWRMKDPTVAGEAKDKFQQIQEAYSVLSDKGKRRIYDAGLLDFPGKDDGNDKEFEKFMQELISMIEREKSQEERSLEDLQRLLVEMIDGDERLKFPFQPTQPHQPAAKRRRTKTTTGL
ncbi:UNVERIFIED_CONTAM: hypothetical protein Scaly_0470600 [Sesamum calycinum]|uniref:J domain-containing protein n=1 Tax=Sesamum calycinum TaxID=2727403 RepID=A0AAW2SF99_9LAMI